MVCALCVADLEGHAAALFRVAGGEEMGRLHAGKPYHQYVPSAEWLVIRASLCFSFSEWLEERKWVAVMLANLIISMLLLLYLLR